MCIVCSTEPIGFPILDIDGALIGKSEQRDQSRVFILSQIGLANKLRIAHLGTDGNV